MTGRPTIQVVPSWRPAASAIGHAEVQADVAGLPHREDERLQGLVAVGELVVRVGGDHGPFQAEVVEADPG